MPVTSVDISDELMNFIDSIIEQGFARNRREVILRALEVYARFEVHRWNGPFITINGIRNALISKASMSELTSGLSEQELYDAGKRMGKTLKDLVIQQRWDISRTDNRRKAVQVIEEEGWGRFDIDQDRITITGAIVRAALLHGYLETALSLKLSRMDTTDDIMVFEIKKTNATKS